MEKWKVVNETNYVEDHTTQLTFEEAIELMNDLEEMFPNEQYSIYPDEYVEPKEVRYYNNNAVDGWEDLYN
jgi:hypothetical protein|tara:strand:+ start:84 stop:296 length:213 start_codon:yes stop_codon:yes gene_type:complete